MTAIMIMMLWMEGSVYGPMVTLQEFSSLDRCEKATEIVRAQAVAWSLSDRKIRAFCVQK